MGHTESQWKYRKDYKPVFIGKYHRAVHILSMIHGKTDLHRDQRSVKSGMSQIQVLSVCEGEAGLMVNKLHVFHGWPTDDPRDFPHKCTEEAQRRRSLRLLVSHLRSLHGADASRPRSSLVYSQTFALLSPCLRLLPASIKCPLGPSVACSWSSGDGGAARQDCCHPDSKHTLEFSPSGTLTVQEASIMKTILAAYSGVLKGKTGFCFVLFFSCLRGVTRGHLK